MGVCTSCLGLHGRSNREVRTSHRRKRKETSQKKRLTVLAKNPSQSSETSRLLFDDPYQSHYGGVDHNGGGRATGSQPDPQVLKREREALEAICLKTSE